MFNPQDLLAQVSESDQKSYQEMLDAVLAEHPTLHSCGFPNSLPLRTFPKREGSDPVPFAEYVVSLLWLKSHCTSEGPREYGDSYGLKHVMERDAEVYVINGAFIAAGFALGLKHRKHEPGNPNCSFRVPKYLCHGFKQGNGIIV
jgi:hypothetical protein